MTTRHSEMPSELDRKLGSLRNEFEKETAKTHSTTNSRSEVTNTQYCCRLDLSSLIGPGHPQSPFRLLSGS
jgi:hypothetical protein